MSLSGLLWGWLPIYIMSHRCRFRHGKVVIYFQFHGSHDSLVRLHYPPDALHRTSAWIIPFCSAGRSFLSCSILSSYSRWIWFSTQRLSFYILCRYGLSPLQLFAHKTYATVITLLTTIARGVKFQWAHKGTYANWEQVVHLTLKNFLTCSFSLLLLGKC